MRSFEVEELIVTERPDRRRVPIGIVSARDIVTRIIAAELDPAVVTAGDIAWAEPDGCRQRRDRSAALVVDKR